MSAPQPFLADAMDDMERDDAGSAEGRAAFEAAYRENIAAIRAACDSVGSRAVA